MCPATQIKERAVVLCFDSTSVISYLSTVFLGLLVQVHPSVAMENICAGSESGGHKRIQGERGGGKER